MSSSNSGNNNNSGACAANLLPGDLVITEVMANPDGADDDPGTTVDNDYHLAAGSPCIDAGDPELAGKYDLVMALECVHDLSRPVEVLDAMRRLAKEGGAVLV